MQEDAHGHGSIVPRGRTVSETAIELSLSPATVNRLLANGSLQAVKVGKRTLITSESIENFWKNLPAATYRTPRKAA